MYRLCETDLFVHIVDLLACNDLVMYIDLAVICASDRPAKYEFIV